MSAITVTCPTCLAAPHEQCRTAWGTPAPSVHQSRIGAVR